VTTQNLVQRVNGPNIRTVTFHDKVLEDGGNITVNNDSYTALLDRVYNVKGLSNMHVEITNSGATNGLIYRIEKCRKEFTDISTLVDADFDALILANTIVGISVPATGTVTLVTALAADTVTINGNVYTAVAGVKANNTQFSIDGTDTVDAADLVDSVTNDTRQGTLADITAANVAGVVTFTSTAVGTAGNAVTLVSSDGGRLAVSGATLAGAVTSLNVKDIVSISPESTAIRIRVRRETDGASTTYQGIVSAN